MKLTIAICTWNRAHLLKRTLEQMARVVLPKSEWEIIVVDNNCTDDTRLIVDSFSQYLPIRQVFEPRQGIAAARNTAVAHAAGDYILWTDDDVLVDREWVVAYERAFEHWPTMAIFGGSIKPWFEGTPPAWLIAVWDKIAVAYATREIPQTAAEFNLDTELPFGANFAVKTQVQKQFSYNCDLGRKQTAGSLGEETEVIMSMLRAGFEGRWVPDAQVRHWIPKQRQTIQYLREYYGLHGVTLKPSLDRAATTLFGRPRWALRKALEAEITYQALRLTGKPGLWIRPLIDASICWGIFKSI